MKYTNGPWQCFRNQFWIDLSDDGKPITVDTEENARLIAAAPDLLSCLEEMELLLEELKIVDGIDLQSSRLKVRSAIRKAKGEL